MDVIKYGFRYWKKYFPVAVIIQICSFLAITADLMIPLLSQLLIDYIIRNEQKKSTGIFAFRKIWQSSDLPAVFLHCRCIWHFCDSPDYINLHKKYNFTKTWTEYGNRFKSGYIS